MGNDEFLKIAVEEVRRSTGFRYLCSVGMQDTSEQ